VKSLVISQGIAEVQDREVGVVTGVEVAVTAVEVVVDMVVVEGAQDLEVDQMIEIEEGDHDPIQEVVLEIEHRVETDHDLDQEIEDTHQM